jgi:hypothetical protein
MRTGLQDPFFMQRWRRAHIEKIQLFVCEERLEVGVAADLREKGL